MKPAVFLDRDNTLIVNDGDLGDPDAVKLIKGAASAIASLRGLGFTIVVVTNQGGVARGRFGESDVDAVNQRLNEMIAATTRASVDRFYYCPYHPKGKVEKYCKEHAWRKPQPGMLLQAAKDLDLDMERSWMIGDQLRDVEAGLGAGVRTILIQPGAERTLPGNEVGYNSRTADDGGSRVIPTYVAPSLAEAVKVVAQVPRPERALDMTGAASQARGLFSGGVVNGTDAGGSHPVGDEDDGDGSTAVKAVDTRPRRVVMAQAVEVEVPDEVEEQSPAGAEKAEQAPEQAAVVATATNEEVEAKGTQEDQPAEPPAQQAPVDRGDQDPVAETADEAEASEQRRKAPAQASGVGATPLGTVLRQILQELRNQRQVDTDFSYITVLAIVLQMIAVMCLLGALLLGSGDLEQFIRWVMVAMVVQLGTIAALLFRK